MLTARQQFSQYMVNIHSFMAYKMRGDTYTAPHDWSLKEEELEEQSSCAGFFSCRITLPVWMAALLSTVKHVQRKRLDHFFLMLGFYHDNPAKVTTFCQSAGLL